MRSLAFVLLTPMLACSASAQHIDPLTPDGQPPSDGGTSLPPPTRGFQITWPTMSPTVDVAPMTESTYCYYFRAKNTDALAIQRWASHMTGVHDMTLYLTSNDQQTPGTTSQTSCVVAKNTGTPVWSYAAQTPDAEAVLPSDDGTGNPVGQLIEARQSGFLQIHLVNTTNSVISARVELNAYAYPDDIMPTAAAPFVALNLGSTGGIMVDPGSTTNPTMGMVNGNCSIPLDPSGQPLHFFGITTYTHQRGVHTSVKDGTTTIFDSTSWEHPGTSSWSTPPFYTFKTNTLTYQCEYLNKDSMTILAGDSVTDQEMCMAIGFFFPAAIHPITHRPVGYFCFDSVVL